MKEPPLDEEDYIMGAVETPDEDEDPDWTSLVNTLDSRDFSIVPPAILDPIWILKMRARVNRYIETGVWVETK